MTDGMDGTERTTEIGGDGARERILRRIREAGSERASQPHPGAFPAAGASSPRRFADAVQAAGGEVVELEDDAAARRWLAGFVGGFGSAVVSPAVAEPFDPALPPAPAHEADLGVSRAIGGAADTGTVLLSSREGRGLQLLPPTHLVWIRADELHDTLTAALDAARRPPRREDDGATEEAPGLPSAIALHSGPSKSADIGRIVVTGVHGPGRLVVALVGGRPGREAPGPADETEPGTGP